MYKKTVTKKGKKPVSNYYIGFYIDSTTASVLNKYCENTGISISNAMRKALKKYLELELVLEEE